MQLSSDAGALLSAFLAYRFARKRARDPRFPFSGGKLGDLAGFTCPIVLGMISILICYRAISPFLSPLPTHFAEAILIAALGLVVNLVSG